MASMSGAFRSHLMQQFASAARCQSRPPLALVSWSSNSAAALPTLAESNPSPTDSDDATGMDTSRRASAPPLLSSIRDVSPPQHRRASSMPVETAVLDRPPLVSQQENDDDTSSGSSVLMQGLIQSRRTVSVFEPFKSNIKEALGRAVACGLNAPNHHRTQAFTFKRLMSPSESTDRLAEIAFHVKLRKNPDSENNQRLAERKREKWSQIPGFLVTLVEGQPDQGMGEEDEEEVDPYEPLPFVGPTTEQQLEDYAAACAAVQNVLLSLHAEGIGAKWATGPVTRTPAFRSLIGAQQDERVVGLVMVGYPRRIPREPRRARPMEELFQDL